MIRTIKSLLTEYGLGWTVNRSLYSAKLKLLSNIPTTEKLFEKSVSVKRIDIFDFDISAIKTFLGKLNKKHKMQIISVADKALDGVITGFSSVELNYGNPIRWHLNPLTGVESKKDVKWYLIPDFDKELGDIKVVWEASRFTHFFYFARAYLITGDPKYYEAFSNQIDHWLKSNPYPYGPNYKCGQECTLRMVNALIAYSIFKDYGLTSNQDDKNITKLVEFNYKKVLSNFFYAHKCIKNNHTFSEICGLIVGAWCCENESAVRKAYRLLDKEIINQFSSDGGFKQYSFNYHRYTLQIIECVFKISEKTNIHITEKKRIKNSVLLLYQAQCESGDVPNYGSNDGALIFPVTQCGYRDFRPVINTVYALINGKRLYKPGNYDEELLWFGSGTDGNVPLVNIERVTSRFNDSGYYIFRHDGGFIMTCLQDFQSRPAHMDQLHIDLWHNNINVFCDSGTYSYASDLGKSLSSTVGHNTVKVTGVEQMNKKGAFLVTDWTKPKQINFDETSFTGTMISKNGYKHTRKINKNENGYAIIDEITGEGEYCEAYFHTPCEVKINELGFELYHKGKPICKVFTDEKVKINKTYRSLFYQKKEEITQIIIKYPMYGKKCSVKFNLELI